MRSIIRVQTGAADVYELATTYEDRALHGTLQLDGAPSELGTQLAFELLLADDTVAVSGTGTVVTCVDGPAGSRITLGRVSLRGPGAVIFGLLLRATPERTSVLPDPESTTVVLDSRQTQRIA